MMTEKENLLETLKPDGKPERFVNQYKPFAMIPCDPVNGYVRGNRKKGTTSKDLWGTTIAWPADQFAAMPHVTADNKVIPDITEWKKYVTVPDIEKNAKDWTAALEAASKVNRDEQLVMGFMPTGLFERLHFLMGFEDALMNLLAEPEDMEDLINVIAEYRFKGAQMIVENLKPDVMLSHDDWGAKESLFFQPSIWREMFKPHYKKMYEMMHDHGVIVMHHSDSFLEPIIGDMVEANIDIWQGALPQNDLAKCGEIANGKMLLMGGIDAAIVDREDATEEEIRKEVRRACTEYRHVKGFVPCLTYGGPGSIFPHVNPIIEDEIDKCSKEMF